MDDALLKNLAESILGVFNGLIGDSSKNIMQQVASAYAKADFTSIFGFEFMKAYGYNLAFGMVLLIISVLVAVMYEVLSGRGRIVYVFRCSMIAAIASPFVPLVVFGIFQVVNVVTKLVIGFGTAMGVTIADVTGPTSTMPGNILLELGTNVFTWAGGGLLLVQLAGLYGVLTLTVLNAPIILIAKIFGSWGSTFMRWIYVVAMTAILTQPIAALILICGFGLTKIEQSIGLPLTLVGFTKILSLLAAGLVPFGMISLGYVKVVRAQIDGGNLDSSGDGKATVDNSYAESPLGRSMSQGAPAGLQLSNSSRLFGSASSVYQGAGNKGFFTSQAAQSAAGAAMVAVGHPEMAQLASRAAGSYVTRNLTAPGPTPPPAPNKPNDDPAGTPADDKSGSLPDPTKPSDQKPTTPPSSPRFGDTSKGSDTNQ